MVAAEDMVLPRLMMKFSDEGGRRISHTVVPFPEVGKEMGKRILIMPPRGYNGS